MQGGAPEIAEYQLQSVVDPQIAGFESKQRCQSGNILDILSILFSRKD